ncbi:hypothetical protein SAPIO_CDS3953 [Scedosporium apiospermum]|uniref:Uncharacterized protein n=1 Tax=Pseudallescheria apiosperma TaxID=563466 RepID=A0A084G8Z0_PSEDA|nr:uncharacterized protein SAPIO_CDS3953 [Scedosporium apiospermum]KEZ43802.1 hypothetical protein SAPIO_CDS3953 [Scedosporium apiospermum]
MSLGCHCLYDGGSTHGASSRSNLVDIVALHDVYEDPFEAWTDPESGINWLRDLLPKHVQVGRVVSYGYDSTARSFFGNDAPENIQRMAESLVQELRANRQFAGTLRRPIIFICHGLGGVLLKKSLIYSSTRTAPKVVHLWDQFVSTFAILFFGTPHGKTTASNWLALEKQSHQSQLATSYTLAHGPTSVRENNQLVQSISSDFMPLIKQFHMFFFWEALPTSFKGRSVFIVDSESAVPKLDNTEAAAIYATHFRMVKFSSRESSDYCTVIAALTNYCEKAPEIISHRWGQAETALQQLRASEAWELGGYGFDVHLREPFRHQNIAVYYHFYPPQDITPTFVGRRDKIEVVYTALFPTDQFESCPKRNTFVIFGMGGSGKTQFCSKFAYDYRHKYGRPRSYAESELLTGLRYTAVFTIYAATKETAADSFCRIGKLAGLEPTENAGRHFLSQLTGPWLLIIDNADDPKLELADLYPSGYAAHILVTTRIADFRQQGTLGFLELGGLNEEEALQLLLTKADIPRPWDPSTREAGGLITKALGYLALALIQAGNCIYRRICDLGEYLSLHSATRSTLQQRKSSAAHQVDEDDIFKVVYSAFDVSLEFLLNQRSIKGQDASDLLKIFSFFHFEHIPVQIFSKAFQNRIQGLESISTHRIHSRLVNTVLKRLEPPKMLPEFLKTKGGGLDKYRINRAIAELARLSLVSFDGKYISLHPLVHAWARDNLSNRERDVWVSIALNTLMASISLPMDGTGEDDGDFYRDVLPHLEVCLHEHGDPVSESIKTLGTSYFRFTHFLQPTKMMIIRDQVQNAAKCGWIFSQRGLFEKASIQLQTVKEVLTQTLGEENEKTMTAMLGLAAVYWGLGRLEEAITLQRAVVDTRYRILGPMNEQTLQAMDHLGKSYWLHGLYREALELQKVTAERMRSTIKPDHPNYPHVLAAMDNYGVTLGAWRRYEESLKVHREVLEARKNTLGETHLDTLTTKANFAMALLDLGHVDEARRHMKDVYEERQRQLGKEHPWTLWALCYLAKVYIENGELNAAEDILIWGIAAGVRSLTETHLGVLMGRGELGRVYARQGRLDEAEKLTLETMNLIEKSRGIAHPDCVYVLLKLVQLSGELDSPREKVSIEFNPREARRTGD